MINFWQIIVLVHVFSMLSWLGAMYFNLVLLFPMYRSRAGNGYAELMQAQGTRAAPLLYALIFLTMVSGTALALHQGINLNSTSFMLKMGTWVGMLAMHLYGSFVIWPRVFFALDSEKGALFFRYKISMLISATLGSCAVIFSYLTK